MLHIINERHIIWPLYKNLYEACIIKVPDAKTEKLVTCMRSNADGKYRLAEFIEGWAFAY